MRTMPVVVMQPARQMRGAFLGSRIGAAISPFAQSGLNEALRFAVGARGIEPRAHRLDPVALADLAKGARLIAGSIVGEHANEQGLSAAAFLGATCEKAMRE